MHLPIYGVTCCSAPLQAHTSPSQVTAIVCTLPATILGAGSTRYHTIERTGEGALHGHGQAKIYDRHLEACLKDPEDRRRPLALRDSVVRVTLGIPAFSPAALGSLTPGPPRRLGAIHSVAIIGGPCGGKSSAIIMLRAML